MRRCPTLGVILILIFGTPILFGAPKTKVELKNKTRDLEKIQAELEQKKRETQKLQKEAAALNQSLEKNRVKLKEIETTIHTTELRHAQLSNLLTKTKLEHDQLVEKNKEENNFYHRGLVDYQVASALLSPAHPVSAVSRHALNKKLNEINDLKEQTAETNEKFEELAETHSSLKEEVNRQNRYLVDVRKTMTTDSQLLNKKETRRQIIEKELTDLEATANELASLIDLLKTKAKKEEEAERTARLARQASGAAPIPPKSLIWPVRGKVTETFGPQRHPELGTPYNSNGVVLEMEDISVLHAVSGGTILYSGNFMSYGQMVLIEHPGDWYTVYGRLGKALVDKGHVVEKGEPVGQSGVNEKGRQEAYFELRFYGKPTDPLPWLEP